MATHAISNDFRRMTIMPDPTETNTPAPARTPMLYKISSVMALLEVSHATVYRMVASGQLELVKPSVWPIAMAIILPARRLATPCALQDRAHLTVTSLGFADASTRCRARRDRRGNAVSSSYGGHHEPTLALPLPDL
jgi:hypothetical protein